MRRTYLVAFDIRVWILAVSIVPQVLAWLMLSVKNIQISKRLEVLKRFIFPFLPISTPAYQILRMSLT